MRCQPVNASSSKPSGCGVRCSLRSWAWEERDELDDGQNIRERTDNGAIVGNGPVDVPVEIDNDHHAIASGDFLSHI